METQDCENNEISEIEMKFKDKLFELQNKRTVVKDLDIKVQKLQLENHDFQRTVEKTKREMQEISVQLEIAIAAARNSESDRMANRETMARQKIQLQATVMDRESLQEQVRSLEVENVKLKRQLQQSTDKLFKQNLLQERFKNKETQWKKSLDQLVSQLKATEESHQKLIDTFNTIHRTSQNVTYLLTSKTEHMSTLEAEKCKLQEKVLSLTESISKIKEEKQITLPNLNNAHLVESELENSLQDMEKALKEKEKEIVELQKALEMSFESIKCLEKRNASIEEAMKVLTNKMGTTCTCQKTDEITLESATDQTENSNSNEKETPEIKKGNIIPIPPKENQLSSQSENSKNAPKRRKCKKIKTTKKSNVNDSNDSVKSDSNDESIGSIEWQ